MEINLLKVMTYKQGKALESVLLKHEPNYEFSDIINIILDMIDEKKINCDKINCNEIVIGTNWRLFIKNGNLQIKDLQNNRDVFTICGGTTSSLQLN